MVCVIICVHVCTCMSQRECMWRSENNFGTSPHRLPCLEQQPLFYRSLLLVPGQGPTCFWRVSCLYLPHVHRVLAFRTHVPPCPASCGCCDQHSHSQVWMQTLCLLKQHLSPGLFFLVTIIHVGFPGKWFEIKKRD